MTLPLKRGQRWVEWAQQRLTADLRNDVANELAEARRAWEAKSRESSDPEVTEAYERFRTLAEILEVLQPKGEDDEDEH